jgi:RNA polymerase primary sigma factor
MKQFGEPKYDDPLKAYLRKIGKHPLLTAEEEKRVGTTIQRLKKKLKELDRHIDNEKISSDEYRILSLKYKNQLETATRKLITSNLRLVVMIAKKYRNRGLSFPDIINEGNIGLIEAAGRFDPSKGYRFSTYSIWWIRQAILKECAEQGNTVRLPQNAYNLSVKYVAYKAILSEKLGKTPSIEEMADYMNIKKKRALEIVMGSSDITSLDATIEKDSVEDIRLLDTLESDPAQDPMEVTFRTTLKENIKKALQILSDREAKILTFRYGLRGIRPRTLREIGALMGLTKERVRQVQNSALKKLRTSKIIQEHHAATV